MPVTADPEYLTDPTLAQLRAAVLDNPADDTHRLMYADYLDETWAGRVPCRRCGGNGRVVNTTALNTPAVSAECAACKGAGYLPDDVANRAELIRVGVKVAGGLTLVPKDDPWAYAAHREAQAREKWLIQADPVKTGVRKQIGRLRFEETVMVPRSDLASDLPGLTQGGPNAHLPANHPADHRAAPRWHLYTIEAADYSANTGPSKARVHRGFVDTIGLKIADVARLLPAVLAASPVGRAYVQVTDPLYRDPSVVAVEIEYAAGGRRKKCWRVMINTCDQTGPLYSRSWYTRAGLVAGIVKWVLPNARTVHRRRNEVADDGGAYADDRDGVSPGVFG